MPYVYFLIICAAWGSNFLLMKIAEQAFGPIGVGAWRVTGGTALLAAVWFARNRSLPSLAGHWRPMLLVVALGYVWPFTIQPYLIGRYGSGFIGMMVSLVPLLTILVSVPMLHIWPTARQVIGVLGGLVCMGIIAYDGSLRNVAWYDFLFALSVPIFYAICNTYIKKRFSQFSPLAMALCALSITTCVLIPWGIGLVVASPNTISWDNQMMLAVLAAITLGVVGTGLSQLLFMKLVMEQGPLFAGMVTYLIPTIAVALAWSDGENVTFWQALALVGVLLMVGVVQYKSAAREA